jgi:hypothetical protein
VHQHVEVHVPFTREGFVAYVAGVLLLLCNMFDRNTVGLHCNLQMFNSYNYREKKDSATENLYNFTRSYGRFLCALVRPERLVILDPAGGPENLCQTPPMQV